MIGCARRLPQSLNRGMVRERLDTELVRRGLATSREQAQALISAGQVRVGGVIASKPATRVERADAVLIEADEPRYVSRGAHKLLGALRTFADIDVSGRHVLDVGASTGGFTQVLLEAGAEAVIALDVGYGQLAWSVRQDPKVTVIERANMRHITPTDLPYRPDLVVADVSFISLRTLLPAIVACAAPGADLLLMVKPQFEVGKDLVGDGVVLDPQARIDAVAAVVAAAADLGWHCHGVVASPLPGPKGNVEYFVWLRAAADEPVPLAVPDEVMAAIRRAVEEGP